MTAKHYLGAAFGFVLAFVIVAAALEILRRRTQVDPVASIVNAIAPNTPSA